MAGDGVHLRMNDDLDPRAPANAAGASADARAGLAAGEAASAAAASRDPELADGAAPPGSADLAASGVPPAGGVTVSDAAWSRDPELADGAAPPGAADLPEAPGDASASSAAPADAPACADPAASAAVDAALLTRRSVRAFLPTPVPRETVERILAVAARAPSGTNTQPWKVYVLTGAAKEALTRDLLDAYNDPKARAESQEEYPYYPSEWVSPYIDRRRKIGWDLYGLLGIDKSDKAGMHEQHARNYRFFGAPVGLMFTIDRVMEQGSWLDYGMFLQSIMVAARGRGLDTCPQAAFTQFHRIIMRHLDAPAGEMLVCGMSLGHADPSATENALVTEREPVQGFTRFLE